MTGVQWIACPYSSAPVSCIFTRFGTPPCCQSKVQPRSQGLSPLPPLSLGKETLVAAGHVTTQNLGGKKICWTGGVAERFDCCCGKLCGFQNLEQPLKTTRFIRV